MDAQSREFRHAARSLLNSPGFSAVAVLTLALGIGANTVIFSIVNAVMLSPLPFPEPDRLIVVRATDQGRAFAGPSAPDGLDYARRNHTLEHFVMFDYWRKNVSGIGNMQPEEMPVGLTPAEYFETLGIRPLIGRLFTADENQFGRHYVAVVSESFWRRRYAGDPQILGRTLRINDETYTVIGVVPDAIPLWMSHLAGMPAQIWTPMTPYANFFDERSRGDRGVDNIARLKPGVSLEQAQADLTSIAQDLAAEYPADRGAGVHLDRLADERAGPVRTSLLLLLGAVGLILLIACANVANLLLVRNAGRRREFAIRTALGGGRAGMFRHTLYESGLLAGAGTGAGVLLAYAGSRLMIQLRPERLPQLATVTVLDMRVLVFTAVVSIAITLLFGLAPAATRTTINVVDALKEGGRASTIGVGRRRLRRVLVVSEIACSLMLMIGAGLLVRSIVRLQAQALGFRADHLLHAHLYLPPARYRDSAALTRFVDGFATRVRALPAVRDAAITSLVPPANRWNQVFSVAGRPVDPTRLESVSFGVADERFLSTFGVALVAGRNFVATDTPEQPTVALVNQALVRRFFPNQDPVGHRVHLGQPGVVPVAGSAEASADLTIVGVIEDFRNRGLADPAEPQLIALYRQMPAVNFGFKELVVRTAQQPYAVRHAIDEELRRMDPDLPLAEVSTVDEMIVQQTSDRRFTTTLLGMFAALGVVLATVGVYGVVAYLVAERTQEIGIRVALGARRGSVLWLVIRPALSMGLAGAAIGLVGALELRQLIDALVFGVSSQDPATYAGGTLLLIVAVVAAAAVPAWRAMRVDPIVALRHE